ncbi:MAG: 1,4-dihydroxy-2-naphthoate octaprenyltransferase [Woeseiaceae bacterium]|nr:1,4-dihydroxy-2-naphthoate octaprenyltransferase [Woeseiaceae bacterium]
MKRYFHATRPKFFPASLLPVLAGSAWGFMVSGQFDAAIFGIALVATLCVHAGANVLNDVGDDAGGTDRQNEDRIYPYTGGSRFIQAGILSASGMARLGITLLSIATVAGFWLFLVKGPMVLWFGIAGVLLATLYSLGPVRLSAVGLGEISVGVAFGILPVVGSAWLQSGTIDVGLVMFALPISAWVAAILLINEVPDIVPDEATGKRTLAVRLGNKGTAVLYALIHAFAAAIAVWLALASPLPVVTPVVPFLLLLLAFKASQAIRLGINDRPAMTKAIESTLAIHTIGSIWLVGCALFVAFWGS